MDDIVGDGGVCNGDVGDSDGGDCDCDFLALAFDYPTFF